VTARPAVAGAGVAAGPARMAGPGLWPGHPERAGCKARASGRGRTVRPGKRSAQGLGRGFSAEARRREGLKPGWPRPAGFCRAWGEARKPGPEGTPCSAVRWSCVRFRPRHRAASRPTKHRRWGRCRRHSRRRRKGATGGACWVGGGGGRAKRSERTNGREAPSFCPPQPERCGVRQGGDSIAWDVAMPVQGQFPPV